MKKTLLLPLMFTVLFSSCVFYPEEDYSKIRGKKSYKSFDSLNEPIVLNYDFVMNFETKGKNTQKDVIYNGTIYAVYDWEKNEVFDYVYAPGEYSGSIHHPFNVGLKGSDGKLSFYGYDAEYQKIYVMKSDKTELTSFDSDDKNSYWGGPGFGEPSKIISGKGLRYFCNDYDNGEYFLKVKTFSSESDRFGTVVTEKVSSIISDNVPVSDTEGNYWFVLGKTKNEKHLSTITRFDVVKNAFDAPIAEFDIYEGAVYDEVIGWEYEKNFNVLCVDSEYVYFSEIVINLNSQKIFRIKKTGGKSEEIVGSEISEREILTVQNVNGKIYVFLQKPISCEVNVFTLNGTGTGLEDTGLSFKSEGNSVPAIRGSKVFFVSYSNQVAKIICVDLNKNSVQELEPVALKDFAN